MIETLIALLLITLMFYGLFALERKVTARILLDHAAARAARAKAVGFNDFMCEKSARVAMIPVAGRRIWPESLADAEELDRIPGYLAAEDEAAARGTLEYEYWPTTDVDVSSGSGLSAAAEATVTLETDDWRMRGAAAVESHYPLYLYNQGF